jgi:hypothetical protein
MKRLMYIYFILSLIYLYLFLRFNDKLKKDSNHTISFGFIGRAYYSATYHVDFYLGTIYLIPQAVRPLVVSNCPWRPYNVSKFENMQKWANFEDSQRRGGVLRN